MERNNELDSPESRREEEKKIVEAYVTDRRVITFHRILRYLIISYVSCARGDVAMGQVKPWLVVDVHFRRMYFNLDDASRDRQPGPVFTVLPRTTLVLFFPPPLSFPPPVEEYRTEVTDEKEREREKRAADVYASRSRELQRGEHTDRQLRHFYAARRTALFSEPSITLRPVELTIPQPSRFA